ncbi:hypothetical protein LPY66_17825 [Dehalobacter sp. DCM]|uniref:uroporphyrinogen decarboxylase family protein n=1 Tax=Dehalobacter sp. DCM TaxID=2907827 RepID=UPI003081E303|nr:hypothetical protein LPY66_17825 [Dehalobacter sp. DCM]
MLSPRENFLLAAVEHKIPEYIPNQMTDVICTGAMFETYENGPLGGGLDGFGVVWHASTSAGGQSVPGGKPVLDDVTAWEDIVKFPDLDTFDWKGAAAAQFAVPGADRNLKAVEYQCWNGQFLRLTHLMGFENALCALMEEPEACYALMAAITDYKIKIVERASQYFKPDIFTSFDDTATERGLFMAPNVYRELIKPHHKRLNDAIRAFGMTPAMHTCGKCEEIIPDFIEEGAVIWTSAQPMNNIVAIQENFGDKLSIIGGYDTNGRPGTEDATDEEIDAEVKRVIETYGPRGGFVIMAYRLVNSPDPMDFFKALIPINAAIEKYGKAIYKK